MKQDPIPRGNDLQYNWATQASLLVNFDSKKKHTAHELVIKTLYEAAEPLGIKKIAEIAGFDSWLRAKASLIVLRSWNIVLMEPSAECKNNKVYRLNENFINKEVAEAKREADKKKIEEKDTKTLFQEFLKGRLQTEHQALRNLVRDGDFVPTSIEISIMAMLYKRNGSMTGSEMVQELKTLAKTHRSKISVTNVGKCIAFLMRSGVIISVGRVPTFYKLSSPMLDFMKVVGAEEPYSATFKELTEFYNHAGYILENYQEITHLKLGEQLIPRKEARALLNELTNKRVFK